MKKNSSEIYSSVRVVFVGNLTSILFSQRISYISDLLNDRFEAEVIDTFQGSLKKSFNFLIKCFNLIIRTTFSVKKTILIMHGGYARYLWIMLFLPNSRVVVILQGSELNSDFSGYKKYIVKCILKRADMLVFRSESQLKEAKEIAGKISSNSIIVSWGLGSKIFDYVRPEASLVPVLISARATQPEYNIPEIFEVVKKIKNEGIKVHFVYINFNKSICINDKSIVDEELVNPSQDLLWRALSRSDVLVSIPSYDGFSNTIIESLALGTFPVCVDLDPYKFLTSVMNLGALVSISCDSQKNIENLYSKIKQTIANLDQIRDGVLSRRNFAMEHFQYGVDLEKIIQFIENEAC